MDKLNLLGYFLDRVVQVEAEGCIVEGKLVAVHEGYKPNHLPTVLILQDRHGWIILRSWRVIKNA